MNIVLGWADVCGEGRNTSSPKSACLGPTFCFLESGKAGGFLGEFIFPGYVLLASQSPYYSLFCGQL